MTFPASLMRDTPGLTRDLPSRLDVAYYVLHGSDKGGRFQYGTDYGPPLAWTREEATTRLREMVATQMVKRGHGANDVEWVRMIPVVRGEP